MSLESAEMAVETDPRIGCGWTGAVGSGWVGGSPGLGADGEKRLRERALRLGGRGGTNAGDGEGASTGGAPGLRDAPHISSAPHVLGDVA